MGVFLFACILVYIQNRSCQAYSIVFLSHWELCFWDVAVLPGENLMLASNCAKRSPVPWHFPFSPLEWMHQPLLAQTSVELGAGPLTIAQPLTSDLCALTLFSSSGLTLSSNAALGQTASTLGSWLGVLNGSSLLGAPVAALTSFPVGGNCAWVIDTPPWAPTQHKEVWQGS